MYFFPYKCNCGEIIIYNYLFSINNNAIISLTPKRKMTPLEDGWLAELDRRNILIESINFESFIYKNVHICGGQGIFFC